MVKEHIDKESLASITSDSPSTEAVKKLGFATAMLQFQMEQRVKWVSVRMLDCFNTAGLIREIVEKFKVRPQTACKYIKLARERNLETTDVAWKEHQKRAIDFLYAVIDNPTCEIKHRLAAQKQLADILPIKAAQRIEIVDKYSQMNEEQLVEEAKKRGLLPKPLHTEDSQNGFKRIGDVSNGVSEN